MSLLTAILEYVEQLEASNQECPRPREDGSPCAQCYERERVIGRLRHIIDERSQPGYENAFDEMFGSYKNVFKSDLATLIKQMRED